ncbi:hypothetical protein [Nocardioides coralli]|uniref:hypothetical protein n=1 Tax=Nocardioides coralli TaxID=2872154 RepID=UPI001CA418E0|nr:hypothetical protein [Nocardioides coralli]QZY30486.1 hypothetical protein K6T13_07520 [Nocardioides coralli]
MSKSRLSMIATVAIASTCLIGAGTAGAVAGQLVTSDDIQDRTIVHRDIAKDGIKRGLMAPNSVTWKKVLSKGAKQKVAAMATDGGKVVGFNRYYVHHDTTQPESMESVAMTPVYPEIELEPGIYQVSVHGITDLQSWILAGEEHIYDESALFHGCFSAPSDVNDHVAGCDSTYVLEVDEPTTLPVTFVPWYGGTQPGYGSAYAEVSVIELSGSLPQHPEEPMPPKQKRAMQDLLKR